jgi:hypothetical protein
MVFEVNNPSIKAALGEVIVSPHKQLIVDTIFKLARTRDQSHQLMHALMGVKIEFPFKILDNVFVRVSDLPTWRMNTRRMREKGLIVQNKVKAQVIKVTQSSDYDFEVTFLMYSTSEDKLVNETFVVSGDKIIPDYEYIDLLE